jgi:hypothetical protein
MSSDRKDTMTAETVTADDLGAPTAEWLRTKGYSAKKVARVVGACEGIGKQLRAGRAPTPEQMVKLSLHFGWDFVKHVFAAVLGPDQSHGLMAFERRLARLEELHAAARQSALEEVPALAVGTAPRPGASLGDLAPPQD